MLDQVMRKGRGLTMVELLVSVAIVVILLAVAVPSMYQFVMRKRVQGTADELMSDLRYARSLQIRENREVAVMFGRDQTQTCYTIYRPNSRLSCDCTSSPVCESSGTSSALELKTQRFPTSGHVVVAPASGTLNELRWHPVTGVPRNGVTLKIEISANSGGAVELTTLATGHGSVCSVSGHSAAYPACATTTASE